MTNESCLLQQFSCTVGKSRSVTVLATAMAYQEDKTFTEALTKVREARPIANPVQGLRERSELLGIE